MSKASKKAVPAALLSEPEGYNGWKNYETWAVALWLDNEEGTARHRAGMARAAWEDAPNDPRVTSKPRVWARSEAARFNLADALRAWVDDMDPSNDGTGPVAGTMWADLIGAALGEVDWDEIADNDLAECKGYKGRDSKTGGAS